MATLIPHVYPVGQPGLPPYAFGARMPRTRVGAGAVARVRPAGGDRAAPRAATSSTTRAGGSGWRRSTAFTAGSARSCAWSGRSRSSSIRATGRGNVHVVGPLMWEPPFAPVEPPPGDAPLVLVAPVDGAGPRAPPAARGARRAGRRAGAGAGHLEPPAAAGTDPVGGRTRGWSSGCRTRRRCPAARWSSATPATARWCARWPPAAGCWPCPTPATWPRTPPALDWAGAGVRLPWPLLTPATLRLAARRALGEPALGARARELAGLGGGHRRAPAGPRTWSRSWRSVVAVPAHVRDELGVLALQNVDRLAVARAQLDHHPLVGQLQRPPDRAVVGPALQVRDRRRGASSPRGCGSGRPGAGARRPDAPAGLRLRPVDDLLRALDHLSSSVTSTGTQ